LRTTRGIEFLILAARLSLDPSNEIQSLTSGSSLNAQSGVVADNSCPKAVIATGRSYLFSRSLVNGSWFRLVLVVIPMVDSQRWVRLYRDLAV
jgi:hypothetical protein